MSGAAKPKYGYVVNDIRGDMVGRIELGEFVIEREYKGNGSYTWQVFNFTTGRETGSFTGSYVGQAEYTKAGTLTKACLKRWRERAFALGRGGDTG